MSDVERALERLDAKPGWRLRCAGCDHEDEVPEDPERRVYRCDQCGLTTAFGSPMPRFTIRPHADRRFLVTTFESGRGEKKASVDVALAREYATEYALELLSVTEPAVYRALERIFSAAKAGPTDRAPPPTEDVAFELDAPFGEHPAPAVDVEVDPGAGFVPTMSLADLEAELGRNPGSVPPAEGP